MKPHTDLGEALREIGCRLDPEEFRDRLASLFASEFPGQSLEMVLIAPAARALPFCAVARKWLGCSALPEEIILGTLLNLRKVARLPLTRSRTSAGGDGA